MDDACAGLDVVDGMSREGTPGGHAEGKAYACPVIDAYCAIAQVGNCSFYCGCYGRVFEGVGVDDDGSIERAPDLLVGEVDGAIDVFGDAVGVDGCFGEEATECFGGEADVVGVGWIDTGNKRPGKLLVSGCAELLGIGMGSYEGVLALVRSWVIGVAGRDLCK